MFLQAKIFLSVFIVGVIGAQALFAFKPPHRYRYWPFLSYPMYNRSHVQDEPVSNYSLVGILEGGEERPITEADLKLNFWRYLRGPVRLAQRDETRALLAILQPLEHRANVRFVAVRLENHPVRLVRGELEPAEVETKTMVLRSHR